MGYEVHITRAEEHWLDSEAQPISIAEWLAYVAQDPEMRLEGSAQTSLPDGQTLRIEEDGLATWTAYSRHDEDGNMAWFNWTEGRVVVKSPDAEIVAKMMQMARTLGARTQGDDGEYYEEDDLTT
jgi:hypothetical protein